MKTGDSLSILSQIINFVMSINLKPNSLELGRSFTVLDFGSSKKQGILQTITFKWRCPLVFLIFIYFIISLIKTNSLNLSGLLISTIGILSSLIANIVSVLEET